MIAAHFSSQANSIYTKGEFNDKTDETRIESRNFQNQSIGENIRQDPMRQIMFGDKFSF